MLTVEVSTSKAYFEKPLIVLQIICIHYIIGTHYLICLMFMYNILQRVELLGIPILRPEIFINAYNIILRGHVRYVFWTTI